MIPVAPASARELVSERFPDAASPVLAGDRVLWGESSRNGALAVRSVEPGGRAELLARFTRSRNSEQSLLPLAASDATLAIGRDGFRLEKIRIPRDPRRAHRAAAKRFVQLRRRREPHVFEVPVAEFSELRAGSLDGPYPRISRGRSSFDGPCKEDVRSILSLDVTADVVVWAESSTPCRSRQRYGRTVNRVLSATGSGAGPPVEIARLPEAAPDESLSLFGFFGLGVRAAGSHVAYMSNDGDRPVIEIVDRSGTLPRRQINADQVISFDVDSDGTLVLARADRRFQKPTVGVVAPGSARFVPLPGRGGFSVRIDAGRIAFDRFDFSTLSSELIVTDVAGGARVIERFGPKRFLYGANGTPFDIGPDSIVWAEAKLAGKNQNARLDRGSSGIYSETFGE